MADADDETTTAPPPPAAPAPTAATPDMLAQAQQIAQQFLPQPVQVDTTPVKRSFLSLLGEAVGGGKTIPMSPADEQRAGLRALGDFGTSLMAASHYQPGQTVFSNLAQGFQGAERSMTGSEQMAAGTLAAQQGYQQQQLQNRLAALKEAIPLLRMQQAAGMPNPLLGGGGAPGGGIGATGAPITGTGLNAAGDSATRKAAEGGPPAPNTPAAAVAQRTHDFWISQGYTEPQVAGIMAGGPGSESDFNSTVSGDKGTSYGLYQYHGERLANMQKYFGLPAGQMPSEAQQNQYAAFEISPKGPLASVGTQLQGAKTPAEAATIWTGGFGVPADKSEIARRANGANRYLGIYGQPPAQGGSATAGGPPASAAPPPSPVARPPAAPTAPAGTIQGTPDTGGTQVGGPGALPGVIRPPGPLVPGYVGAIVGGMTKAGASPTTLAPGGGTAAPTAPTIAQGGPPTVTPPAQPTPQVTTQQPSDNRPDAELTLPQYIQRYFQPPTDADRQTFTVGVNPAAVQAQQVVVQNAQRQLAAAAQDRQLAFTPEERAAASKNYGEANQTLATATAALNELQGKADTSTAAAAAKFAEDQRQRLTTTYNQLLAQKGETDRLTQGGQQAIALEHAKGQTADESKVMQGLDETRESARTAIDQIGIARGLSQSAGDPTFWQTVQKSHPDLVQAMANSGFLSPETVTQLGQAGALDAATNKLISMARTGSGFQRMTNLDVQILSSQAPQSVDPQAWRDAKLDYLQTYMTHQMDYIDTVRSLRAGGTPLYDAQKQAAKESGDIVPQIPNFADTPQKTAVQQRIDWAQDHLAPNTFFRAPDGKLVIYRGQQGQTAPQTTAPAQSQSLVPVN